LLAVLERWAPERQIASLGAHEQHGVRVTVALETDRLGRRHWIAATYAPVEPGVHLYGASLPAQGIDGLGRPTVLRVADSPLWRVTGDVVADRVEYLDRIDALGVSIPVYPPGAVTLRVPVRLAPHRGGAEDRVTIGYMGCSEVGCLPPVTNRSVMVRLPGAD
jgi:hypothetical protein